MRNVSLKLAASLLVFIGASAPVAAQDAKNYPGALCLASGSANTSVARSTNGRGFNQATTTVTFICPAIKDTTSLAGGRAWVIDQNPGSGEAVTCFLRSGRPDSTTALFSSDTTDPSGGTFSSSSPVLLTFDAVPNVSDSFYFLQCSVPGTFNGVQSGVVMYQVIENE